MQQGEGGIHAQRPLQMILGRYPVSRRSGNAARMIVNRRIRCVGLQGAGRGTRLKEREDLNLKTAVKFKQKDAKDTKSVTCEDPAQI